MAYKFIIPPPQTAFNSRFFLSDATHHPNNGPGKMLVKQAGVDYSNVCCCLNRCPCLNELEDAGYPDLTACFVSNGTDPCDNCFVAERCVTLTWNGIAYTASGTFAGCADIGDTAYSVSLSCEGAGSDWCRDPQTAPAQDVDQKWWLTLACDGCFWGVVTASTCSPFELTGTICVDGPATVISRCCDVVMGFGIYGCIDFTITEAP